MPFLTSRLYIDWDQDDDYLDTKEDASEDVLILEGVTSSIGKDQLRVGSPPKIGDFKVILSNESRDYSLENSSSPLAGLLEPGKKLKWELTPESGAATPIFTGQIEDITQNPQYGEWTVELPAFDLLVRLRDKIISTGLLESVTTDEAIEAILDAAGWPASERIISTGGITLEYYWADSVDAFSAIQEIVNTEGPASRWGVDGAGNFIFEDRRYRLTETRSTTPQASFSTTAGEAINIAEFQYRKLFKDVINKCALVVRTRAEQAESVIWSVEDPITFNAGETKTFRVSATDPFKDAVTPTDSGGINEVQKIHLTGNPTGGSIFVSFRGASPPPGGAKSASAPIGIGSNAAAIQNILQSCETIGIGNVAVTAGPLYNSGLGSYNDVFVEFRNALGSQDVELLGVQSNLTGGTDPAGVVEQITQGARADYRISAGSIASITLDKTSGGSVLLTITAGPTGATLDWLQVRAKLVSVEKETEVENTSDASASIARHGEQRPRGPFRAEISEADAVRIANAYVDWFKKVRPTAELVLDSGDVPTLTEQVGRQVSDLVSVEDDHTGVDLDFWIENVRYELTNYNQLRTVFGLESIPVHSDAHTDTHSDVSHSDSAHSDNAHSDVAHSDMGGHSDSHSDDHTDAAHSDSAHSDGAHSDAAHGDSHVDFHSDGGHSDSYSDFHSDDHSDAAHSDSAHSDVAHSDSAHGDSHSDVAHTDAHSDDHGDEGLPSPHTDSHSDTHSDSHTDTHSDASHGDSAHSDVAHSDDAHGDSHSDVAHTDSHTDESHSDSHTDDHTDAAHSDGGHSDVAHSDDAHGDTHSDSHSDSEAHSDEHSDVAHSDSAHSDDHSDVAHSDSHTDTHTDTHSDVAHGDTAHGDSHSDSNSHTDSAHSDFGSGGGHSDVAHGDSHTDGASYSDHSDAEQHSDEVIPHTDSHSDNSHSDSTHTDTHSDTHSDVAHSDAAHTDTHSDASHGDSAHSDTHTDDSHTDEHSDHSDVAHTDVSHGDASHGDAAHSDVHTDTHSDEHSDIL